MTQIVRPIADAHVGSWTTDGASSVDVYATLTDDVPTTYAQSEDSPVGSVYVMSVEDGLDYAGIGGILAMDADIADALTTSVDVLVELREAYVDENTQGGLIASATYNVAGPTSITLTPTADEIATITAPDNLYVRLVVTQEDA